MNLDAQPGPVIHRMQLRRVILKALLWSLAAAAVAGVLAVLLPTRDIMVRVMMSGVTAACGAGLMIIMTFLLDRRQSRWAGLFGMSVVVVQFILWNVIIWLSLWLSAGTEERLAVTCLVTAFASLFLMLHLVLLRSPRSSLAGWIGGLTAAATLVFFLVAIWRSRGPWGGDEWWETGWAVGGYGLLLATCLLGARPRAGDWWRWLGALTAVGAALVVVEVVWRNNWLSPWVDNVAKPICVLTSTAAVAGFANLCLWPALRAPQRWVRWGTIFAAAVTAVLINIYVLGDRQVAADLLERLIAAAAIVTSCGSLAIVILTALNRRSAIETEPVSAIKTMTVVCPTCRRKQNVTIGTGGACERCGLEIEIRVREPRCPSCQHLLLGLTSNRCPECGVQVMHTPQ